jgi:lysophospholipase L1-like esterase
MEIKSSSCELTWTQLLEKEYVFGIPLFYNKQFLPQTTRKDIKSISCGTIHRFPDYLRKQFPYLDEKSRCTSGIRVEFNTDAQSIQILSKITKIKHRENFSNMAQAGIDVMVDGNFWMIYYPKWENAERIYLRDDGNFHRISLVLPNYAGIRLKKIILDKATNITPRTPKYLLDNRPIVYYGSSITQGGCASRPALAYSQRLSDTFCMNYVNLSISGNARGELELAKYVAEFTHAALFILDWGANLLDSEWGDTLEDRYEPFWRTIYNKNPQTPILFIGLQNYSRDLASEPCMRNRIQIKREFIQQKAILACNEINQEKKRKIFDYIDGTSIIDTESLDLTLDGVHPNDIGHKKYADLLEWKIIDLLGNHVHS